jgi:uncharacterized integral membrane protein
MRIVLDTRIHRNAPGHAAAAFGLPMRTTGVFREVVSRYPKPLTLLFALIMLAFATATLEAQSLAPTRLQEFNTAVQPASRFETYGRAGLIGNEGPHAVTIETVVALGVAYVVLGGIIFALAASFRLLSDKVDSFFALLIPEPVPRFTSRN